MPRDLLSSAPQAAPAAGGKDLLAQSPQELRADRLKKLARISLDFGRGEPGAMDRFSDSFTWGLMKPVAGLATGASEKFKNLFRPDEEDVTFGEGYQAGTGAYQERLDEAVKKGGWTGTVADVAGSVGSGGPARNALARITMPRIAGQAATQGAVEGAARNSENLTDATTGAVKGAVTSAVTAAGINQAAKLLPANRAARAAEREAARGPSGADIRTEARNHYRQLDQSGTAYDNNQSVQLADTLRTDLRQNGWDPGGVHASMDKVLNDIEALRGQPMSLETLANLRERVGAAAREGEPQIRRIAGRTLNVIDGFVDQQMPALSQMPGNQVGPMWREARRLWRTAGAVDDMNWRLDKAERRAASTNSGQNTDNAIRQNVRGVQDRATQPGRYNPYTPEELAQMSRVVEGGPMQNALRWTGNQVAGIPAQTVIGGLAGAAGISGAMSPIEAGVTGLAGTALTQGAGHLLKQRAAEMTQDEADTLVRLIATGSRRPYASIPQGPPTRANLARLLMEQQAARGGANLASGKF